jgi:hydrogenase maturation protease
MPEHAEAVAWAERVIFVDAARDGEPGAWTAGELAASPASPTLAHALDAPGLLAAARDIYHAAPRAILVSAAGESFDCRETLTSRVEAVVPGVVNHIDDLIAAAHPDRSHA